MFHQDAIDEIKQALIAEAQKMYDEDIAACKAMGAQGASLLPQSGSVFGALQCGGAGDLWICFGARRDPGGGGAGTPLRLCTEQGHDTLQGARLTAQNDARQHSDCSAVRQHGSQPDAGRGKIQAVIVVRTALRPAATWRTRSAYGVAVLAHEHGIPFYVAAPWSTLTATPTGDNIRLRIRR